MPPPAIVWFRHDLRLRDNPALEAALAAHQPILPVYIWSPGEDGDWQPGAASRWWLHHSLAALAADLQQLGSRLIIRRGPALAALQNLAAAAGASLVFWNRRYEPEAMALELRIEQGLNQSGLTVWSFNASLFFEPSEIRNKNGAVFQVFTPFWKTVWAALDQTAPRHIGSDAPTALPALSVWPKTVSLESLRLLPRIRWDSGLGRNWQPGESGAHAALREFMAGGLERYPEDRDRPDVAGVSRLSPHLHFGEISPWRVRNAILGQLASDRRPEAAEAAESYLRQLGWREFAAHLLCHFPRTVRRPLRVEFEAFPWHTDDVALAAWKQGKTGYPIVDAGMRELWETGWMHNRVRMIAASFLVKDLMIPWQEGAAWFWNTLVDADLANNTLGWQWTAGCGADAAPYFRIFNPVLQGMKFDPSGAYIRRWLPEIAHLPTAVIHQPQQVSGDLFADSAGAADRPYPVPIVDHKFAAARAQSAYSGMKKVRG